MLVTIMYNDRGRLAEARPCLFSCYLDTLCPCFVFIGPKIAAIVRGAGVTYYWWRQSMQKALQISDMWAAEQYSLYSPYIVWNYMQQWKWKINYKIKLIPGLNLTYPVAQACQLEFLGYLLDSSIDVCYNYIIFRQD